MKDRIQNIATYFFLGSLCLSAFYIRFHVARNTRVISFDESVYFHMAHQVSKNGRDYTSRPFAEDFIRRYPQVDLPEYLFHPLYKHPPLFTFFNAAALKLSLPLEFIPIGFSVLTILITYLLGTLVFGRAIGLISAFFLAIDPISTITSQKLWPDSCMTFFMISSLYLFIHGLKNDRPLFFVLSGVSIGLAGLTKYPGLLILSGIAVYRALYKRLLSKTSLFIISSATFFPLSLWFLWLWKVYGNLFFVENLRMNEINFRSPQSFIFVSFLFTALLITLLSKIRLGKNTLAKEISPSLLWKALGIFIVVFCIKDHVWDVLSVFCVPNYCWKKTDAFCLSRCFYISQLLKYSLVFMFGFAAFFLKDRTDSKWVNLIKINSAVIMGFFTVWGNFQSRYILATIPLFILLGMDSWRRSMLFFHQQQNFCVRNLGKLLMLVFGMTILIKTAYINLTLSFSNAMFYY